MRALARRSAAWALVSWTWRSHFNYYSVNGDAKFSKKIWVLPEIRRKEEQTRLQEAPSVVVLEQRVKHKPRLRVGDTPSRQRANSFPFVFFSQGSMRSRLAFAAANALQKPATLKGGHAVAATWAITPNQSLTSIFTPKHV